MLPRRPHRADRRPRRPGEACQFPQASPESPSSAWRESGRTSSGERLEKRCVSPSSMTRARPAGHGRRGERREATGGCAHTRPHSGPTASSARRSACPSPRRAAPCPGSGSRRTPARPARQRSPPPRAAAAPLPTPPRRPGPARPARGSSTWPAPRRAASPAARPRARRRRCTSRGGLLPASARAPRACLPARAGEAASPESKGRNRETGDHGNVCSTRTHVLLSSSEEIFLSVLTVPLERAAIAQTAAAISAVGRFSTAAASRTCRPPSRPALPPTERGRQCRGDADARSVVQRSSSTSPMMMPSGPRT